MKLSLRNHPDTASNSHSTYGWVERTLHWAVALLLISGAVLGKVAYEWPYDTSDALATKATLFSAHKTVGVSVFFLALFRIGWAISQPRPAPLHPDRKWETALASTVHWLLYGSLVLVPLMGWLHHASSTGFAPIWWPFGQSLPFVPKDPVLSGIFGDLHETFVKLLFIALLLHILGTLKHVFVDRDLTLPRMWKGADPGTLESAKTSWLPIIIASLIWATTVFVGIGMADAAETDPVESPVAEVAPDATTNWIVRDGTLSLTVQQMNQPVSGAFGNWTAAIRFDETRNTDGTYGSVTVTIDTTSLTLGAVSNEAKAADFLNVGAYPTATFQADIMPFEDRYIADGTLDLRGLSVPVRLPFDLTVEDDVAAMQGQVTLDRRYFNIGANYNNESDVGFQVLVDVDLIADRTD